MTTRRKIDPLDIPSYLYLSAERRRQGWAEWSAKNPPSAYGSASATIARVAEVTKAAETIRKTQRAIKIEKLKVRMERIRARDAGELRKMPPQGRDALRVIDGEK